MNLKNKLSISNLQKLNSTSNKIKEFQNKKKDGSLTINFRKGGVRNIKREDVIHPPK